MSKSGSSAIVQRLYTAFVAGRDELLLMVLVRSSTSDFGLRMESGKWRVERGDNTATCNSAGNDSTSRQFEDDVWNKGYGMDVTDKVVSEMSR